MLTHKLPRCRWKRETTLCLARCSGKKKEVAHSAISSHTQGGLAQTHWYFELITDYSHNPFSVFSFCVDTNFTTSPSSQSICPKIVVGRGEADTWHRLRLKASLNGGISLQFSSLRNERQSRNYPPFFSICCTPNLFGGIILH